MVVVTSSAHHGVLAECRKSFFRSLATRFRRQSLGSEPLGRQGPLQFGHGRPSHVVNGLLRIWFHLSDTILIGLKRFGDQLIAGLAT